MQNRKRQEGFAKNFLYESKSSFNNNYQHTLPATGSNQQQAGSRHTYGNSVRSHLPQTHGGQGDFYTDHTTTGTSRITTAQSRIPQKSQENYYSDHQRQGGYDMTGRSYTQRSAQGDFHTEQDHLHMADIVGAGDGNLDALKAKYSGGGKNVRSRRSQTRQDRHRNPGETYSDPSVTSSRSDISRQTIIEQGKKGKQLIKLTHSRANLLKTVDEGMSGGRPEHCCCTGKMSSGQDQQCAKEMIQSGSESNACSTPSAGVINEKIIHPMVKKFRLLYLHNIKEEVTIMEDLEMLPHKLDEICKKMENDNK